MALNRQDAAERGAGRAALSDFFFVRVYLYIYTYRLLGIQFASKSNASQHAPRPRGRYILIYQSQIRWLLVKHTQQKSGRKCFTIGSITAVTRYVKVYYPKIKAGIMTD